MADIFVSHARHDRGNVTPHVAVPDARGGSVQWLGHVAAAIARGTAQFEERLAWPACTVERGPMACRADHAARV